ncbi:MAG TPA: rod shape-determining protein MreC [Jatrophihabitantaceae bacterium]
MRRLTARQRLAAIVLVVVAACFVTLDVAGSGLDDAHGGVRGALGALYRGTDGALGPARRFVQGLPAAGSNEDKIAQLRKENAALRARLAVDGADARTKAALAKLHLAAGGYRVLPARAIAVGPGQGFDWTLSLDVGSSDGVRAGQTVTDGVALVGRVLHTSATSCVVLLAADPGSGVGARDTRNGQLGVATGHGPHGYTFVPLDPDTALQVGDTVQTGPAGRSTYTPGLAIGTITAVHTAAGAVTADVRTAAPPTALDLVGVILAPTPDIASAR